MPNNDFILEEEIFKETPLLEYQDDFDIELSYNRHYILLDNSNNIIEGWSDGPHYNKDTSKAICINEQGEYQFRLFPNGEENPSLFDFETMAPLYKYEDGQVIKRTEQELNISKIIQRNKNLNSEKQALIANTKQQLARYLENNPLILNGKKYSVTQEKQSLLTSQLALYMLNNTMPLSWNASGEPCTEWTFQELANLANIIAEYVHPFVTYQQEKEVEINNATTGEELDEISINFDEARIGKFSGNFN